MINLLILGVVQLIFLIYLIPLPPADSLSIQFLPSSISLSLYLSISYKIVKKIQIRIKTSIFCSMQHLHQVICNKFLWIQGHYFDPCGVND